MEQIILQVVIILGIIIAGGFLIFFLGDLLMSIVDPKRDEERVKAKKKNEVKKFAQKVDTLPEEVKEEVLKNEDVAEVMAEAKAIEEPQAEQANNEIAVEAYVPAGQEVEEEQEQEDDEQARIAEARAALEKRKEEILRRIQAQIEDDDEEEEDEEEQTPEAEEDVEEDVEEEADEENVEEAEEEIVEVAEPEESEQEKLLRQELEEAKRALEAEKARYEELAKQIEQAKESGAEQISSKPALPKEEYERQLVELQERLSANEKELRACKREYLPLAKIKKTLERDEKKLRRKEAAVAKQQMMVYGVNNYSDIDEEKAKKLAEELDLYDGLKLSVQNCKDVMENNKDRFPVLEKMYYILKAQNEQIKNDILEAKQAIEAYDEEE